MPHLTLGLFGMVFAYFTNAAALQTARRRQRRSHVAADALAMQRRVVEKAIYRLLGPLPRSAPSAERRHETQWQHRTRKDHRRRHRQAARPHRQGLRGPPPVAHRGHARRHLPPGAGDRRPQPAVPRRGVRQEDALGHAAGAADHRADDGHAARRRPQRSARRPAGRALDLDRLALRMGAAAAARRPHPRRLLPEGDAREGQHLRRRPRRSTRPTRRSTTTRTAPTSACATTPGSASSAPRRPRRRSTATSQLAQWKPEDIAGFMEEYRTETPHGRALLGRRQGRRPPRTASSRAR